MPATYNQMVQKKNNKHKQVYVYGKRENLQQVGSNANNWRLWVKGIYKIFAYFLQLFHKFEIVSKLKVTSTLPPK